MQFVDEATIEIVGGAGGPGLISFRREAHVPLGGPNGGDGGRGGNVILVGSSRCVTLLDHRYKRWYRAQEGARGGSSRKTGRGGEDIRVPLPLGTIVTDVETGEVLVDLTEDGQELVAAKGGRGGLGNARFKTSTRQTPRYAQDGEPGVHRKLALSLKLVADIGLVGLPNAGKSTFIRAVTNSQAQVGAYPFTTLTPNLGVYRDGDTEVVVADIPGLIAGAHRGEGLGDAFLKHLERTRAMIHLVSLSPDATEPLAAYDIINGELAARSAALAARPQLVVLNKIDVVDDRYELELWTEAFRERGVEVLFASGVTRENVSTVMRAAVALLPQDGADDDGPPKPWSPI